MAAPGKKKQPLPKRKGNPRVEALAARFALDALERRVVEVAYELERSLVAAEKMRKLGGLTVERLRAIAGDGVDAALSPRRALRRHALVVVAGGGMAAATDEVRLGPGLAARLDGAAEPDGLWLGTTRILPGARGDVPARIAPLLAGLNGAAATLLTLDGCPRREAHELAAGLARHTGRGVLVVDGELLLDAADPALLLACARREADCDGDVLVVCEAGRLGERWRALLAPSPSNGTPAPLVVLADAERTREPVAAAPFGVRRLSLHPPAATAASSAPATSSEPRDDKPAPIDDGLDGVRQQAIRDAERALGIFRAPPPPPRAPVTPIPPPLAPRPAAATSSPPPVTTTPAPTTSATPAPTAEAAPPPRPTEPGKKRSSKGAQFFGGETTSAPPPPPPAPAAPLPAPPTVDPASLAGDGPPLPIPNDATPDDLARIATTSPSAAQRIELINRLRSIKSAAVVAALRANAASLHPGVRAAAESAMAVLFGPNWNATRPIAKPVQPPSSDDKDRGPPGGW